MACTLSISAALGIAAPGGGGESNDGRAMTTKESTQPKDGETIARSATELYIFARFHAQAGREQDVADALSEVLPLARAEPGCLGIQAFRASRDPRLFFIHSRWKDEAAFDLHATLPHTVRFIERVSAAIDHPLDVNRTQLLSHR